MAPNKENNTYQREDLSLNQPKMESQDFFILVLPSTIVSNHWKLSFLRFSKETSGFVILQQARSNIVSASFCFTFVPDVGFHSISFIGGVSSYQLQQMYRQWVVRSSTYHQLALLQHGVDQYSDPYQLWDNGGASWRNVQHRHRLLILVSSHLHTLSAFCMMFVHDFSSKSLRGLLRCEGLVHCSLYFFLCPIVCTYRYASSIVTRLPSTKNLKTMRTCIGTFCTNLYVWIIIDPVLPECRPSADVLTSCEVGHSGASASSSWGLLPYCLVLQYSVVAIVGNPLVDSRRNGSSHS